LCGASINGAVQNAISRLAHRPKQKLALCADISPDEFAKTLCSDEIAADA
jgi:hypothetical protein